MDRILDTPGAKIARSPSRKEEIRLLFPGETSWEWWSLSSTRAPRFHSGTNPEEASLKIREGNRAALPVQHVIVLPLWLATTDASLMRDMVSLQLENYGLLSSGKEAAFNYQVIRQEKHRTLLTVTKIKEDFPENLCFPRIKEFCPASDYWSLPADQLLVWKELEFPIFAFTSGEKLLYVQSSPPGFEHNTWIHEAHCARLILESDHSLPSLLGITVFGTFSGREIEELRSAFQLPLQHLERPLPAPLKTGQKLLPGRVISVRHHQDLKKRNGRYFVLALSLYLLLLSAALGQLAWLGWKKTSLDSSLAKRRPEVAALKSFSAKWQALEPAILPEAYPLEMLYRCTLLLPEQGVRLVTYEQEGFHIHIAGEAKNAPAAFQFIEDLKKSPNLDTYSWEMTSPEIQPNDSIRFVIEGKKRDASPEIK